MGGCSMQSFAYSQTTQILPLQWSSNHRRLGIVLSLLYCGSCLDLVLCLMPGSQLLAAWVVYCLGCSLTQCSPLLCFSGFTGLLLRTLLEDFLGNCPWSLWLPFYLGCSPIELWDSLSSLLEPWDSLSGFLEL